MNYKEKKRRENQLCFMHNLTSEDELPKLSLESIPVMFIEIKVESLLTFFP